MIDYAIWAQHLLEEIMLAPRQQREAILKSHLERVHQRGYRDAVRNDWWQEQETPKYTTGTMKFNTENY